MRFHPRPNDYRFPRTMQQAFGPYAAWPTKRESALGAAMRWAALLLTFAAIGVMLAWRG